MGKRKISIKTDKIASFVHLNKIIELSLTEDDMLDTSQLLEVRSYGNIYYKLMYVQHTMQPSDMSIDGPITDIEDKDLKPEVRFTVGEGSRHQQLVI